MKKAVKTIQIKNKHKRKQVIIVVLLFISTISLVTILGRFVTNKFNNFYLTTKEFYFKSDKLTENVANYQIENWSGVEDYIITINMNSRKNNLIATSYDIGYNISYRCSNNVICELSKTSGTIYATQTSDFFNITITPNTLLNQGDKVWVEITATSSGEYKKTLTATFTLVVGKEKLSYEIIDNNNSPYFELNLTNTLTYYIVETAFDTYNVGDRLEESAYLNLEQSKRENCYSAIITLTFDPEDVLLDMINENYLKAREVRNTTIDGVSYINRIKFKMDAAASTQVRFYKKDVSKNYTFPNADGQNSIITVTTN